MNGLILKHNLINLLSQLEKIEDLESYQISSYVDEGGYTEFAQLCDSFNLALTVDEGTENESEGKCICVGVELEWNQE